MSFFRNDDGGGRRNDRTSGKLEKRGGWEKNWKRYTDEILRKGGW